jgi:uncharacterized protein involved in exopolysaccharide biosynthesis
VQRLDQELARQGAAVLAFKAANKSALPDSLDFRRSQQAAAQERLLLLDRQESELMERRAQLGRMQAAMAQGMIPAGPNETAEQIRLRDLRDELKGALAVFAPSHPRVKMLEAQVAALDHTIGATPVSVPGLPPVAEQVSPSDLQLADLDSQMRFLSANRTQVEAQIVTLTASINETPPNAITLGTLERDYANLRAQYDDTVAKKARAETGDVIEALSKGQRISIIEQATAPRTPDRPNRPVIAAGGVGLGLALGLGMVLLLELLSAGVRRPVEITSKLGITPFATLPYLRTRGELLRRRVIIGAAFALALAGVPLSLWLLHTQYMPLDLIVDGLMWRVGLADFGPLPLVG